MPEDLRPINLRPQLDEYVSPYQQSKEQLSNYDVSIFDRVNQFDKQLNQGKETFQTTPASQVDEKRYSTFYPGQNNEEIYAQSQSGWDKAYNGVAKMVGTASSTFLNGTVGLVYGIGKSIEDGKFSSFYDNPLTNSLNDWTNSLEDKYAHYKTQREINGNWWEPSNLLTGNFLWDNVVKNLGFSVGAAFSGFGWGEALEAIGLTGKIVATGAEMAAKADTAIAESLLLPEVDRIGSTTSKLKSLWNEAQVGIGKGLMKADQGIVATFGTAGESGMEALNNSKEFRQNMIDDFVKTHGYNPEQSDLDNINKHAQSVGNSSFLLNTVLLSATNYIQLPKIYSSSFKAEKDILNNIAFNGEKFVSTLPEKGFGKLLYQSKNIASLFFNEAEAFEEGAQYAIQTGTQNYYAKKYRNQDASVLDDGILKGVKEALTTNEGLLNIFTGGFSGALQSSGFAGIKQNEQDKYRPVIGQTGKIGERGVTGYGGEEGKSRDEAISTWNNSLFKDKMKDVYSNLKASEIIQQQRETSIRQGDILESKDLEFDYAHTYINSRLKYNAKQAIIAEVNSLKQEAYTDEGFSKLQQQGYTAPTDTRESFLNRLTNFEEHVENTSKLTDAANLKYKGLVNKDTDKRIYSDEVIDKLVYAASKVADYDKRIPELSKNLLLKGISIQNSLEDILYHQDNSSAATKEALNQINSLNTISGVKDDLKSDLKDIIEMSLRRKQFIKEYDEIKQNPSNYSTPKEDLSNEVTIKQRDENGKSIASKIEVGTTYNVETPHIFRDGNTLSFNPELTVLSKTLGGELEVKLPNGQTKFIKPNELKDYPLTTNSQENKQLEEVVNNTIDKVLDKEKNVDFKKLLPEDATLQNKLSFINTLNNKILVDEIQREITKATKELVKKQEELKREEEKLRKKVDEYNKVFNQLSPLLKEEPIETPEENKNVQDDNAKKPVEKMLPSTVIPFVTPNSPQYVKNHEEFLSNFDNIPNSENIKAVIVTKNNEVAYGLDGLHKIGNETYNEKTQSFEPYKYEEGNEPIFIVYTKDGEFIDVDGNPTKDVNKVVFGKLPEASITYGKDSKYAGQPRYDEKDKDVVEQYLKLYKDKRQEILASTDKIDYNFNVEISRGVASTQIPKNFVEGSLLTKEQLGDKTRIKVFTTTDGLNGRVAIVGGVNSKGLQYVNNRNLTQNEQKTIPLVLKEFVKNVNNHLNRTNEDTLLQNKYTKFLQGVTYFSRPNVVEGKVSPTTRNQIFFEGTEFVFGTQNTKVLFSDNGIDSPLMNTFLQGAYNHVSLNLLKNNEPFIEFYEKDGKLEEREWKTYSEYLLSSKGRTPETVPLSTQVASKVEGTKQVSNIKRRYAYLPELINTSNIVSKPIETKEIKKETPTQTQPTQLETDISKVVGKTYINNQPNSNPNKGREGVVSTKDGVYYINDNVGNIVNDDKGPTAKDIIIIPRVFNNMVSKGLLIPKEIVEQVNPETGKKEEISSIEEVPFAFNNYTQEVLEEKANEETPDANVIDDDFAKPIGIKGDKGADKFKLVNPNEKIIADFTKEFQYIKDKSPLSIKTISNLINAGNGLFAWGSYKNGVISLYENMQKGTGYHELFHGVVDCFLDNAEKEQIFKEFRDRDFEFQDRFGKTISSKDASNFDVEEQLAEEFKDFVENNEKPNKSAISKFFDELWNFIQSIFNNKISSIDNLFKKIDSGYYKNTPIKSMSDTEMFSTIGTFDVKDTNTMIKAISSKIVQNLFNKGAEGIKTLNELDFGDSVSNDIYDDVYKQLFNHYRNVTDTNGNPVGTIYNQMVGNKESIAKMSPEEFQNRESKYVQEVQPIWKNISDNWEGLKQLAQENLKTLKIIQKDEIDKEGEESDYTGKEDSYTPNQLFYDGKVNAPASIKLILSTLLDVVYANPYELPSNSVLRAVSPKLDDSTKIETLVKYASTFNKMISDLSSFNTLDEKEAFLKQVANKTSPNYIKLLTRIFENAGIEGWNLRVKLYSTFSKQVPSPVNMYVTKEGTVHLGDANVDNSISRQADSWLSGIKDLFPENISTINNKLVFTAPQSLLTKQTSQEFLKKIGINFTNENLKNININLLDKEVEPIQNFFKKGNMDVSSLKNTTIAGRIKTILSLLTASKGDGVESTFIDSEGKAKQTSMQTNTASKIANDFNNSKTTNELIQKLPHLDAPYAQDSYYVKNLGKFKTAYYHEFIDEKNDKAISNDKLNKAQRLISEINNNLKGNYNIIFSGDSQLEHMYSNMDNVFTLDQSINPDLSIFYSYYQTEQALGGSENRLFSFLGEGKAANDLSQEQFEKRFLKFLKDEVDNQFQTLKNYNVITQNDKGFFNIPLLIDGFQKSDLTKEEVDNLLMNRTLNYAFNNTEIHKIVFGDPALYSDLKRFKSFLSPRETSMYGNPEYLKVLNSQTKIKLNDLNTLQLKQGDPQFKNITDELKTVKSQDVFSSLEIPGYEKINGTDGGAICPLVSYREMMQKNGARWGAKHQSQFEFAMAVDRLLMEQHKQFDYSIYGNLGKDLKAKDQKLIDPDSASFNVLKPILSGFTDQNETVLDKFSIAPITFASTLRNGQMTTLSHQYVRMLKENISYVIVDSGRKVSNTVSDSMYNEDGTSKTSTYNPLAISNVSFKWFGIQVETQGESRQPLGSQLSALATVNLLNNGVPLDVNLSTDEWLKLSEEEKLEKSPSIYKAITNHNEAQARLIENGYQSLLRKIGSVDGEIDKAKLLNTIKDERTKREITSALRNALEIDPETNDFKIPLEALTDYKEIRNILFSYVKKQISTPSVNGANFIMQSSSGYEVNGRTLTPHKTKNGQTIYTSDTLGFYKNEDGKRVCEVLINPVPIRKQLKKQFKERGIEFNYSDEELFKLLNATKDGQSLLTMVGFRIPTQDINSVDVMKVVGFLPSYMGKTIAVPEALTTKVGLDFDVDKMNTYIKNLYVTSKGEIKLVPKFKTKEEAEQFSYTLVDFSKDKNSTYNKDAKNLLDDIENLDELEEDEEFDSKLDKLYTQSLENDYFQSIEDLLQLPENFDRLVTPLPETSLKAIDESLQRISPEEFGEGLVQSVLSPSTLNTTRHSVIASKQLVGIAAMAQKLNALLQKSSLVLDPLRISTLDKKEKEFIKDGSVKLPHNKTVLNGKEYVTLSANQDVNKLFTSDKNSELITGSVDALKNNILGRLGLNKQNLSTYIMLAQMGVENSKENPILSLFINQPIIREYLKLLESKNISYPLDQRNIDEHLANFGVTPNIIREVHFVDKDNNVLKPGKLDKKDLLNSIQKYYGDKVKLSDRELHDQYFILNEYLKYNVMSSNLFRISQSSIWDTQKFKSPSDLLVKQIRLEKAQNNNVFSSVNNVLNSSYQGAIKDKATEAIQELSKIFKFLNPTITPFINPLIKELTLRNMKQNDLDNAIKKVEDNFINYLIFNSTRLNNQITPLLINSQTSLSKQLFDLKKSIPINGSLQKNTIFQELASIVQKKETDTKNIRLINKAYDVLTKDMYEHNLQEIKINQPELYGNIVRVAFLQSGIGKSSLLDSSIIPIEDFKKFIIPALSSLSNTSLLEDYINSDAFYKNVWRDDDITAYYEVDLLNLNSKGQAKRVFTSEKLEQWCSKNNIPIPLMYKVATVGKAGRAETLKVKNEDGSITLIRKVPNTEQPYDTMYPQNTFSVYYSINALGDGYKGLEFYQTRQPSQYNNNTFKLSYEFSPYEISNVLNNNVSLQKESMEQKDVNNTEIQKPFPGVENIPNTGLTVEKANEFINHSGGAKGGDMQGWDAIGREFGVTNHNHYTVAYYDKLTAQEKTELDKQYLETVKFLGRGVISKDTYAGKLVRRDMIQANNGESVYGVTELVKPNITGRKGYKNRNTYSIPEGGTGYATARGILLNKPTYIFNQSDKYGNEIGWYKWDNNTKDFVKTETPTLSKNFTGIGSQEINELGLQAIKDVYEKTLNQPTEIKLKIDYSEYSKLIESKKGQLDLFSQVLTEEEFNSLPLENQKQAIFNLNC